MSLVECVLNEETLLFFFLNGRISRTYARLKKFRWQHEAIHGHIRSFPLHESHYSGEKVYYLSTHLSVKSMWTLFMTKYPQFRPDISYYTYWNNFMKSFGFRFGRP